MSTKVADLFIELGIEGQERLKGLGAGLRKMTKATLGVATAVGIMDFGLQKMIQTTLNSVVGLENFNKQTGISVDKLNAWKQAGQLSNLNLGEEQVLNNIQNLQDQITNIALGRGGNAGAFQMLGIDLSSKDAFNVLEQVRTQIKGLSDPIAVNLIKNLGLSPDMLNVLRLSNVEFNKLSKNDFLSGRQRKDILKMGTAMKGLKLRVNSLKDQLIAKLAPALEKSIIGFGKWLKNNKTTMLSTLSSVVNVIGSLTHALGMLTGFLLRNKPIFIGIGLALAVAFAPVALVIGGLLLLLEDFVVYLRGGESVIGDFVEMFKKLANENSFIGGMRDGILMIKKTFDSLPETMQELIKLALVWSGILVGISKLGLLGKGGKGMGKMAKGGGIMKAGLAGLLLGGVVTGLKDLFTGSDTLGIRELLENMMIPKQKLNDFSPEEIEAKRAQMLEYQALKQVNNNSQSVTNVNQDININIDGAGSPQETGHAVAGELQNLTIGNNFGNVKV